MRAVAEEDGGPGDGHGDSLVPGRRALRGRMVREWEASPEVPAGESGWQAAADRTGMRWKHRAGLEEGGGLFAFSSGRQAG